MYSKPNLAKPTPTGGKEKQSSKPPTASGGQKPKNKVEVDSGEDSLEEEKQIMLSSLNPGSRKPELAATQTKHDGAEDRFGIKADSIEKDEEIESRYSDTEDNVNENQEEQR